MSGASSAAPAAAEPVILGAREGFWLDPRTKVVMLVCANVTLLASGYSLVGFALKSAAVAVAVALLAQAGRRAFAFGFSTAFLASLVLELLNEGVLLEALGATSPLAVLLRLVTAMVLSFLPGTVFAYYLFATTTVSEFVAAFERLRLPQKVIIPFAVVFRFFPTVLEEYRSIRDAMHLRGVGWRCGPVAMVEYRLVPLIVSLVKIGDELSAASVARGLGGEARRTSRCQVGFGAADIALAALMLALAAFTMTKGVLGW